MKKYLSIRNIYFFLAACIFVYLILRAIYVPPVHDEAATFMHYIQRNEWKPYKAHWDANNHILNSLLSARIFKIFGYGTLYLRLASLLFFPVFVWYTYKISGFLKSNIIKIGFLCGMLGVHNLLEYFGYSRGYAMSMGLLMASIFYVLTYFQEFKLKKLGPFYFFSLLALAANLTLFNTIVILNGILFLAFIFKNKQWILKFLYLIIGVLPIIFAAILSIEMKKLGLLYYGGDRSFYHITVRSLVVLIYDEWHTSIALFFILLSAMGLALLGAGKFSCKTEGVRNVLFTNRWVFAILFLGNILAVVLLQKIMKVNYPEDRTAMYFYFFLVLFFCFTLDHVSIKRAPLITKKFKADNKFKPEFTLVNEDLNFEVQRRNLKLLEVRKKLSYLALIWVLFPIHFLFNINLTHATYWYYEHIPNSFYKEIEKRVGEHPEQVSIGGYVLMDMIWAYYNHQTLGKLNDIQTSDYPSFYYDFLLLYDDNNNAFAQDYYNVLIESPYSHIRVLERKEKIQLHLITEYSFPDQVDNWNEYSTFFENDSLKKYRNLCFDFTTHFQNSENFFFGMFTLGTDTASIPATRESQELHLTRTQWKKGYDFHHRIYVQNVSPESTRIVLYFWNPRKVRVNLTNNFVKIYTW